MCQRAGGTQLHAVCLAVLVSVLTGCAPVLKKTIRLYQKTLGPVKGWRCQFEPSCSQFAYDAIDKHGSFVGMLMWGDRSIRCHPFAASSRHYLWEETDHGWHLSDPVQDHEFSTRSSSKKKSPWIGGALSAVIPGAGYFYAGRPSDGVSAFLKTGLWVGLAAIAKNNDQKALAVGLGGIGAFYYASNIYGAAQASYRGDSMNGQEDIRVQLVSFSWR